MEIRKWFGLEAFTKYTESDKAMDKMLELCREALNTYFSVSHSENINELVQKAHSNDGNDTHFLEWITEKGLPRLNNIDFSNLPNEKRFVSMIEIDEFVLKNEMDFSDPDEVRGCIISFVNSLDEYIALCKNEVSASIESLLSESDEFSVDDEYNFDELFSQNSNWGSAEQVPFFMEEFNYGNVRLLCYC